MSYWLMGLIVIQGIIMAAQNRAIWALRRATGKRVNWEGKVVDVGVKDDSDGK